MAHSLAPHPSMRLTRRSALLGLTAAVTLGRHAMALGHAQTDRRFVVVILRGALDGMSAVVPYGDPALATWRADLIPGAVGTEGGMRDLGGFYGLHPALANQHDLYKAGELLPVHAVAGPTRVRSHFEAQDYLEFGVDHQMVMAAGRFFGAGRGQSDAFNDELDQQRAADGGAVAVARRPL